MCPPSKPSPPPAPEPTPPTPPVVVQATTKKNAPKMAESTSTVEKADSTTVRKKRGRGSLRIPLTSSGLAGSGVNFPTA